MDNQNERLGSLMILSDIALILSTYGILFAFNYFVTPISTNMWIVCTFFVGIKILIVGIADVTGIGKNPFVSIIFVLIADVIIVLINQLMAFGISLRMLLIMTIVDVCLLLIACFIWRGFIYKRSVGRTEEVSDWFETSESPNTAQTNLADTAEQKAVTKPEVSVVMPEKTESEAQQPAQEPQPEVFTFDGILEDNNLGEQSFFTEPAEPEESFLSFEELTDSLDSEAVNQELETEEPEFEGEEINFYTAPEETVEYVEPQEPVVEYSAKEETVTEEPVFGFGAESATNPAEEQVFDFGIAEEPAFNFTTEEETPQEEIDLRGFAELLNEQATPVEEGNPLPLVDAALFNRLTGQNVEDQLLFTKLPNQATEEEIQYAKADLAEHQLLLSDVLGSLIQTYNLSDDAIADDDQIEISHSVSEQSSFLTNDNILKNQLKDLIEREFIEDDVLEKLAQDINHLNSRYSEIQNARRELAERQEEEKKRREEQERQEAQLKRRREEAKRVAQERKKREQSIQMSKPVRLRDYETHLTSDGIDIIINRDDLEILREYLKEQNQV